MLKFMNNMKSFRKEYLQRINRVIDYIEKNLDQDLSLENLADIAHFSSFHFHRIFTSFTGEALHQFIKRKRVEKAARLLLNKTEYPINEIACDCGFNSTAVFCRSFKSHFGMTAQTFRKERAKNYSKNDQWLSKNSQLQESSIAYLCNINSNKKWKDIMENNITIKKMPALNLVYIRQIGPYHLIGQAYDKLFKWAKPRGLFDPNKTQGVTIYHDDPEITDIEKIQHSTCITVDKKVNVDGELGYMKLPACKCAIGSFEIGMEEFETAWSIMCGWVTENGYQAADIAPYELYHNHHEEHPERKFIVDICIPIEPIYLFSI